MPSRKRINGQARKARKAADEPRHQFLEQHVHGLGIELCRHGSPPRVPEGHLFSRFYDKFYEEWNEESIATSGFLRSATLAMIKTHETIPQVWNDDHNRETMKRYFLTHGTNILLDSNGHSSNLKWAVAGAMAAAVHMLENYNQPEKCVDNFFVLKHGDVFNGRSL